MKNIINWIKKNLVTLLASIAILVFGGFTAMYTIYTYTMGTNCHVCADGTYQLFDTSGTKNGGTRYTYKCDTCNDVITVSAIL